MFKILPESKNMKRASNTGSDMRIVLFLSKWKCLSLYNDDEQ